jgi:CDP-diacylglycerol--serine O-phosphatidyltransferase
VVLAFILVSTSPPEVLFGVFVLYGLSGYGDGLMRFVRGRKKSQASPLSIYQSRHEPERRE